MYFLHVPTTRAGSVVTSDSKVVRDIYYSGNPQHERCSVVLRIAPTFLRWVVYAVERMPCSCDSYSWYLLLSAFWTGLVLLRYLSRQMRSQVVRVPAMDMMSSEDRCWTMSLKCSTQRSSSSTQIVWRGMCLSSERLEHLITREFPKWLLEDVCATLAGFWHVVNLRLDVTDRSQDHFDPLIVLSCNKWLGDRMSWVTVSFLSSL